MDRSLNQKKFNNEPQQARVKAQKKGMTYDRQKFLFSLIFLLPWMIGLGMLFLYPFIQSVIYSFFEVTASPEGGLDMQFVGFANYIYDFNEHVFKGTSSFKMEILYTLRDVSINVTVMVIFSLFIAALLNTKFRGRAIVRGIFFIPVILNSAAVASIMANSTDNIGLLFEQGGLSGAFNLSDFLTDVGLPKAFIGFLVGLIDRIYDIVTLSGVPILLFLASIQSIPKHLYEAAKIEGATSYEMFWLITVPNVKPHFLTVIIYGIVDTFMTSSINTIIQKEIAKVNRWGEAASMGVIYALVIVGLLLAFGLISKLLNLGERGYE